MCTGVIDYLRLYDRMKQAESALKSMTGAHGEQTVIEPTEYRQRFQASWRRSFPYLPPDLFSMVGDRMTPRVEAPWLD